MNAAATSNDSAILVLTTIDSDEKGKQLATAIVEAKLAACVSVVPSVTSVYRWKGQLQTEHEHLLLIKTTNQRIDALKEWVRIHHPYDEPELLAFKAVDASSGYLNWLFRETDSREMGDA
jgi:periplasmic divalent cation tolerance protein